MSNDSVCPREHFKDKPVDVSRSTTGKTQSRAGDTKKKKFKRSIRQMDGSQAGVGRYVLL